MAQFLIEVTYNKKEGPWSLINRIPCLDKMMIRMMKRILNNPNNLLEDLESLKGILSSRFLVAIKKIGIQSFIVEGRLMIRKDDILGWEVAHLDYGGRKIEESHHSSLNTDNLFINSSNTHSASKVNENWSMENQSSQTKLILLLNPRSTIS